MENKIKMVALDFDMTLVDHTATGVDLPSGTRELLIGLIDSGIDVGIISGRYWWEMQELLEQLEMKWGDPFPSFIVTREAFIYWLKDSVMKPDADWNDKYTKETTVFIKRLSCQVGDIVDHLESKGLQGFRWILFSDYAFEIHCANEEDAELAASLIQQFLRHDRHIRTHRNRTVTNVLYSETGKGKTLLHLANSKNLKAEQVLAIGDSLNDLDMLDGQLGFKSGAVGNAAPAIKDAVKANNGIVVNCRAGLGVAEIINEYKKQGFI